MRTTNFQVAFIAAILSAAVSGPAMAATKCPASGLHFTFKGLVKGSDTTKGGQTFYNVLNARCGGSEDGAIAVYPPSPVPECLAGKHASASGSYRMKCLDDAMSFGGVCVASLTDATLTCK